MLRRGRCCSGFVCSARTLTRLLPCTITLMSLPPQVHWFRTYFAWLLTPVKSRVCLHVCCVTRLDIYLTFVCCSISPGTHPDPRADPGKRLRHVPCQGVGPCAPAHILWAEREGVANVRAHGRGVFLVAGPIKMLLIELSLPPLVASNKTNTNLI